MRAFLALGDSHFDETRNLDETVRVHDWIAEQANALAVDAVIHTGDVYERASTPTERHAVADWVDRLGMRTLFVVRGNHDALRDVEYLGRLRENLPPDTSESPGVYRRAAATFFSLPWPTRAGLLAAVAGRPVAVPKDEDLRVVLAALLRYFGASYGQPGLPRILAAHALVDGSITSTGQPLRSAPMHVHLDDLALARPDVILLGHVHKPQGWALRIEGGQVIERRELVDGERLVAPWVPCAYTGSPTRTTYGESEEKSVLHVVQDDEGGWTVTRLKTPTRPMILAVGAYANGRLDVAPLPEAGSGADVRVRYAVPFDQRDAAAEHARALEGAWALSGAAARVTWEPETTAEVRVRAPEVAAAHSLPEKLAALRAHRGDVVPPERAKRLGERLARYEGAVASRAVGRDRAAAVRFKRLRVVGLGALAEADLDLASLPSVLAVCGENGAGKSTLLEAAPAALWRKTATRASLRDLASSRESVVEAVVALDGEELTVRQDADAGSGRGEWSVTRRDEAGEGAPVLADTKLTTGEAWAAARLPDFDLWMASCFAAQGSEGFLGLEPRDRKRLLLSALGTDHLEALAAEARADAGSLGEAVRILRARSADASARVGDLAARERAVLASGAGLVEARMALATAEAEHASREAAWGAWSERDAARREAAARADGADAALRTARDALDAARKRAGALRAEREALATPRVWPPVEPARAAAEAARVAAEEAAAVLARAESAHGEAIRAAQGAARDAEAAAKRLRECRAAGERLAAEGGGNVEAAETALREAEAEWTRANEATWTAERASRGMAERRIKELRAVLLDIAGDLVSAPSAYAKSTLEADDALAAQGSPAAVDALRAASDAAARARGAASDAVGLARRARDAQEALRALAAEEGEAYTRSGSADARRMEAEERIGAAANSVAVAAESRKAAQDVLHRAAAELRDAERFQALRERCERLDAERIVAEKAAAEALQAEGAAESAAKAARALVSPEEPAPARPDAEACRCARAAVSAAEREHAAAEGALERARADEAEALRLGEELTAGEVGLEDATRLADELGRTGLQSHEIDAAGPKLSETANALLHECYGPRWTVRFVTTRPKKGSDELTDCYEIEVADSATGSVRSAWTFSGGERTILSEAIGLAIAAFLCARRGVTAPTLFRDESGAALDAEKVEPYVRMLRRGAAALGGSQVLVVSHSEALRAACDGRIVVGGGRVRVEG